MQNSFDEECNAKDEQYEKGAQAFISELPWFMEAIAVQKAKEQEESLIMEKENAVRDNKPEHRFELTLDEGKVAFIDYRRTGAGVVALTHTEVPEEFEGKGIGNRLVKGAFEILQQENLKIVPTCSFVAAYLRRHPEYKSLVG